MFKDATQYDMTPAQVIREGAKKFQGLTIPELAKKHDCHHATIQWHLTRWGNLDRLMKDYHKTRATVYWGKTRREWHEYISQNIGDGQKIPSHGSLGGALTKGKKHFFNIYLPRKLGKSVKLTRKNG